tara:strand:- start:35455 stop:35655 length:201 start_codon:yes stop_codon:yes gene_type:complete
MQTQSQSLEQEMRDLSEAYAIRQQIHRSGTIDAQDIDADWDARTRAFQRHLAARRINIRAVLEASL